MKVSSTARILRVSWLFACLLAGAMSSVSGQTTTGTIKGTVTDSTGKGISYATVGLRQTSLGTATTENGHFEIKNVPAGNYVLFVSSVGFVTMEQTITVKTGETLEINSVIREKATGLDEVVVSASRSRETIDKIPSSITVVSLKSLEQSLNVTTNLNDILEAKVPGLAPSTGTSSNWGQTLRGRPLLIMIDGIPQSTPLRNGGVDLRSLDPLVIERVEVIKGATAIYGNGAAGGLINYVTRMPDATKPFSSVTSLGASGSVVNVKNSLGSRFAQAFMGKKGKFEYIASGSFERTGELKDAEGDVLPPDYGLGETHSYNGFVKAGYAINENHHAQISYNYYSSRQKTKYIPRYGSYVDEEKTIAVEGEIKGVPQGITNHNASLQLSGQKLPLNTGYDVDFYYQQVDNIFFYSPTFVDGGQSMVSSDKKGARFVLHTPFTKGVFDGKLSYGLDLLNDITSQPLVDGRSWVPEMDMSSFAPFAQLKFNLFQSLVVKGGFRMEKVNISVDDYATLETVNTVTGAINPSFNVKGGKLSYDTYLFNAGIRYNKFSLFTPYISFSQGFSVSDIGVMLRSAKVDDINKINTEAIVINNYETGFVSKYKKFRFEGVAYASTSELGASGKFVNGVFEVVRSPELIYGFEAVADFTVNRYIKTGAAYAWVEGKMDVDDNGSFEDEIDVFLGGERISPPKLTAYVSCELLKEKLDLTVSYTGIQSRIRFEPNSYGTYNTYEGPVKAYDLVNFSAGYKVNKRISVTAGVENLFNEDYFPARSQWFTQPNLYTKGKGTSFRINTVIRL